MDQGELQERIRRRRLEVVAYGCHERAWSDVKKKLRNITGRVETFVLIEYFCDWPIAINNAESEWNKRRIYFPYVRRIIEENQFIWISRENDPGEFSLQPGSSGPVKKLEEEEFLVSAQRVQLGREIFNLWKSRTDIIVEADKVDEKDPDCHWWRFTPGKWEEYKMRLLSNPVEDMRILLKEYGLAARPWVECDTDCLVIGFPLATAAVFYGYLLLLVPAPTKTNEESRIAQELAKLLDNLAKSTYLPVLTILYESFLEEELKDELGPDGEKSWKSKAENFLNDLSFFRSSLCQGKNHDACPNNSRPFDEMERALHKLWIRRKEILEKCGDAAEDLFRFRETLLFEKYVVASPGVMKQLKKVMASSFQMPKDAGDALPAALVFGGPGSGKDTLARMIPLFSEDYLYDSDSKMPVETYIINMASLSPPAITGPLFQGISVVLRPGDSRQEGEHPYNLEGLLVQAKKPPAASPKSIQSDVQSGGGKRRAAFILDELNSLDIDLQGILLRIIENGEVTPLGSLKKEFVEHLIIGVVNENPKDITREREIKELLGEQGRLGSLISGFLYEMMRRTRRLREDLYHRLKRKLYIEIPDLKDRLEDIPILFYAFLSKERPEARVSLSGYKLLMAPSLLWPGNVRELQSVVQKVILKLTKLQEIVDDDQIREVLDEEFPGALRQDGRMQE